MAFCCRRVVWETQRRGRYTGYNVMNVEAEGFVWRLVIALHYDMDAVIESGKGKRLAGNGHAEIFSGLLHTALHTVCAVCKAVRFRLLYESI